MLLVLYVGVYLLVWTQQCYDGCLELYAVSAGCSDYYQKDF
jgi:hypothetical protein